MGTKAPTVWDDLETGGAQVMNGPRLDTPAWLAWLAEPATTSFSYPVYNPARGYIEGFMTVRKERRARGGAYWTALLDGLLARRRAAAQSVPGDSASRHRCPLTRGGRCLARATPCVNRHGSRACG